jgi:peptidoglycan hydrolase-like protein with peptidoglycan-binding domain
MNEPQTDLVPVTLPGRGDTFLDQSMVPKIHTLVDEAHKHGLDIRFNSAFRTPEQQAGLHHDPTAITPATHSLHSAGFAVDVEGFMRMSASDQKIVREAAKAAGLQWGGGFNSPDPVHFYTDPPIDRMTAIANATRQYQDYQQHHTHSAVQSQSSLAQIAAENTSHKDVLQQNAHGTAVHALQADLAKLGYKDGHGHPLKADGDFGPATQTAEEAFQRDHGLLADGKVGHDTRAALEAQIKENAKVPGLDDPKNPDHALYEQALAGVRKLDVQAGRTSDQHSANLAAALVVAAKKEGMTRIDTVVLSTDDGSRVFAVQNSMPLQKFAEVPTLTSLNTPIAQSSAAVTQVNQQQAAAMTQVPVPVQTPIQSSPAMSR